MEMLRRNKMRGLWRVWLLIGMMGVVGDVYGQRAEVAIQRGVHYVGEAFVIEVTAEGFEEAPQPECLLGRELDAGVSVKLAGVSPNVSTQVIIRNGQRQLFRRVSYVYRFHVEASGVGIFEVGPFVVKQGGKEAKTQAVRFEVASVALDPEMRVALRLPEGPIYPSQRVPVTIEWWYAGDLDNIQNVNITSPLFDGFEFEDAAVQGAQSVLPLNTAHGRVELGATAERRTLDGRQYVVVMAERTLIADRVGTFDFEAITAKVTKVTQWRRDVFGRQAAAEVRIRAVGEKARVVVQGLPSAGRPASFAGAVGTGFHVKARADRSVVNVGDPIRLTVDLGGSGNLTGASLPRLDAGGEGLVSNQFGVPAREATGRMVDGVKRFEVDIRVKDAGVNQIPPVAYSWFDPEKARYETVYTDPIALVVNAGRVVSAADVVSGVVVSEGDEEMVVAPAVGGGAVESVGRGVGRGRFDLSGADLAIGQNVVVLLGDDRQRFGGEAVRWVIYGVGILVIGLAWLLRGRAEADPAIGQRRRGISQQVSAVVGAKGLGARDGAGAIADALRQVTAYVPGEKRGELDELVGACDALSFAPEGEGGGEALDGELYGRAVELVKSLR